MCWGDSILSTCGICKRQTHSLVRYGCPYKRPDFGPWSILPCAIVHQRSLIAPCSTCVPTSKALPASLSGTDFSTCPYLCTPKEPTPSTEDIPPWTVETHIDVIKEWYDDMFRYLGPLRKSLPSMHYRCIATGDRELLTEYKYLEATIMKTLGRSLRQKCNILETLLRIQTLNSKESLSDVGKKEMDNKIKEMKENYEDLLKVDDMASRTITTRLGTFACGVWYAMEKAEGKTAAESEDECDSDGEDEVVDEESV